MRALKATLLLVLSLAQTGDADFTTFYRHFRTALVADDGAALASLTARTFMMDGKQLDSVEFSRRYRELFDDKVKQCFAFASPIAEDDAMTVSCAPYIFYFRQVNGPYRLTDFAADPESEPNEVPANVTYATSYDIRQEPFRNAWFFGPIAAAMLLVGTVLVVRAIRNGRSLRGGIVVFVLTVILGIGAIGIPYWDRMRLIGHLTKGTTLSIEGTVVAHEAREVRVKRSGESNKTRTRMWEAFEVGGVRFGYYQEVDQAGFHNSTEQRQEIADGMRLRIQYVEDKPDNVMERRILVIEKGAT